MAKREPRAKPADTAPPRRIRLDRETPLFGSLPPNLMRPLSSSYRAVFEDVLIDLVEDLFHDGVGGVTYNRAIGAIRDTLEGKHPTLDIRDEEDKPGADRAYVLYNGLVSSGWLVETGFGPNRAVDFNPNARLLLNGLIDIKNGMTLSWGGEVLTVLTLVEAARARPKERAEAIRSAWRAARNFQHHLRSLTSHLVEIEREILASADLTEVVSGFFEKFVGTYLIEDYKRLKSRTNPFRDRDAIVDKATATREDPEMMEILAKAYHAQGRSRSHKRGFETVYDELTEIIAVFSNIGASVTAVEVASQRLERKFINLINYRDRYDEESLRQVTDLATRILGMGMAPDAVLDVPFDTVRDLPVIVPDKEAQKRTRRGRRERAVIDTAPVDPAFRRYYDEMLAFQNLVRVTEDQACEYLARAMRAVGTHVASLPDLPIASLEDALVVSQLRRLFVQGEMTVGGRFRGILEPGLVETEWLDLEGITIVDEAAGATATGEDMRSWA